MRLAAFYYQGIIEFEKAAVKAYTANIPLYTASGKPMETIPWTIKHKEVLINLRFYEAWDDELAITSMPMTGQKPNCP